MVRIVAGPDVRRLLPMSTCVDLMERALTELARGDAEMPVRLVARTHDGRGVVALMPAHLGASGRFGYKAVTVFPDNDPAVVDTHEGAVAVLDPATGRMLGLVDGTAITTIRTAAVSAVATRHLARADARVAAILGAGVQARSHVEALAAVRDLAEMRIWSRDPDRARAAARETAALTGLAVEAIASAEAALRGADIVVTATSSRTPVLQRHWLGPGAHVNAVGACVPTARELDTRTVADARLIVDQRAAALAEAGDILLAIADGAIGRDHIAAELGEVVIGRAEGRTADDQLTVFESLGLGVEDVAAAGHVLDRAASEGVGTLVEL
jgi:ornithine cyclodeaminase